MQAKEEAGEESEFFCPNSIRFVPRRRRRPKPKKQGDAAMMSLVIKYCAPPHMKMDS